MDKNNESPLNAVDHPAPSDTVTAVRALNDQLRQNACGGSWVITEGISGLGPSRLNRIIKAVAEFNAFTADNDPYGEHDSAVMMVDEIRIIWKIDYYDKRRQYRSPDPADTHRTNRVLTVMRADEF